jgi:NAD(P)-dependent dehydrogenase (short-subunit alcohol dehydrogenase family)
MGALGTVTQTVLEERGWSVVGADKHNVDLTNLADTQRFVDAIQGQLNAVVHLVGGIVAGKPIHEATRDDLHLMLTLNVVTAFNVLHATMPRLIAAGGGGIVSIGARDVLHPSANRAAYAAAKSAVVGLTRAIAEEGRPHHVRANVIVPSILRTAANLEWGSEEEAKTWVDPRDVAATIAYLIDPTTQISGAVIPMYGGIAY